MAHERYVFIHSPLVGPSTWSVVADELQRRGATCAVPEVPPGDGVDAPYWRQHASAAAQALAGAQAGERSVLVAHSGAGPLLPGVRQLAGSDVAAYVFVDAGIPRDGTSRLGLLAEEMPQFARGLRDALAAGGRWPNWRDEELRALVPDDERRRRLLDELRPQPLAFWDEPLPVFAGWPDAPCAYLQFSAAYDVPAARAREAGWPYQRIDGGHFHMLVEPSAVTDASIGLVRGM